MGYVIVVVLAVVVGGLVYWFSVNLGVTALPDDADEWRADPPALPAQPPGAESAPRVPDGSSYIPVSPSRASWQSRLTGVMGLVVAVGVAAIALAAALYEVGALIARVLSSAANSG